MAKRSTEKTESPTIEIPRDVLQLVAKFDEHRESYRRAGYNETQLRQDFLDPFFVALGWDVYNRQGYAEAYRDVILEQALQVEKSVRAPDYCFRVGGTAKFFVEAKKPAVDIKSDVGPAFQLRRYAWSAKLPLSILTDFEELAVYDCRVKPDKNDKASTARVMLLPYTEYVERWDEIASVFSRDAILRGSFDKYAESHKKKRGTAEVDDEFLKEIEDWRESLAKNLSLRNPEVTDRQLNFAVQRIIDRVIFLRMCEGRGIEPYGGLQTLLNGEAIYPRLVEMFYRADEKYNSGLFHFQPERGREPPDELTTALALDDKVLKEIIRRLYYPESPYEFAALPADILGQVYEQFLGKVIRLTAGHRAKIEEKPEVRKAGGVYYTPTYIVDYIVENTVGKLLEDQTPQEVGGLTKTWRPSKKARPLSVLDPACGSGSFLIVAYQYLMDWYLKQYTESDDPRKHTRGASPRVYQTGTNDWRLTISERKRILLAHIYGVDIDFQAVEVTKLSLLLKALEGESKESVARTLFHKERALPDLANNIKCGNSLIGPDFFNGRQRKLFDEVEVLRINAFDWQGKHGFPEIFSGQNPGFDAVIGNPPWLMAGYYVKDSMDHLKRRFRAARGKFDLYYLFIEQGCRLLQVNGRFGMIVPNKFFHTSAAKELRQLLSESRWIKQLVDFGDKQVFRGATNYSCILVLDKQSSRSIEYVKADLHLATMSSVKCPSTIISSGTWHFEDQATSRLFAKLRDNTAPLESLVWRFGTGVQSGADRVLTFKAGQECVIERRVLRSIMKGRDVRRYRSNSKLDSLVFPYTEKKGDFVILDEAGIKRFPKAYKYLLRHRETLAKRVWFGKNASELSGHWYGMMYLDSAQAFQLRHLLTPSLSNLSNFTMGTGGLFVTGTAGVTSVVLKQDIVEDIRYVLGVLNSKLLSFYAIRHSPVFSGGYYKFSAPYLKKLPIRCIDNSSQPDRVAHDRMVADVQQMLDLHARLPTAKTAHDRTVIERRIEATDRQIDQLVYELYGLTDKEIALVEAATAK
jgi:hypothetical protein